MERYCYLYHVTHQYLVETDTDGSPINETKEIGLYTTKMLANQAIERFKALPGFCDYPECFSIAKQRCYLKKAESRDQLSVIYSPYHEVYLPDSDCDLVTTGCLFDTHEEATEVLEEWKASGICVGGEENFNVLEYQINGDGFWREGFSHAE
ncbi:MAG: hypothetical protein IKB78_05165 [Clostridia bacterium]|nr:hypothetical protein [Clostridia bacterium]